MKNDELKALEDGQGITFTRKKRFNNGEKCNALQQPPLTHTNCSILGKLQMNRPLKGPCFDARCTHVRLLNQKVDLITSDDRIIAVIPSEGWERIVLFL